MVETAKISHLVIVYVIAFYVLAQLLRVLYTCTSMRPNRAFQKYVYSNRINYYIFKILLGKHPTRKSGLKSVTQASAIGLAATIGFVILLITKYHIALIPHIKSSLG